tara:strand:+ start:4299 stop:4517 length:219 start_codon:yes stop_codon:yes gene_type:complete
MKTELDFMDKSPIGDGTNSKGLGDTIDKVMGSIGVRRVVKAVSKAIGKDCGCKQRKDKLNKAFPYKPKKLSQ